MPQPLNGAPSGIQYKPRILIKERPEHLARIGLVVAEWAVLEEHLISITAFALFGMTNREAHGVVQATLSAVESNRARLQIIEDLLKKRGISAELLAFFTKLKSEIMNRAKERNRIAHGYWGIVKELPDHVILMSSDNEHQKYTIKDFEDIVERIIKTSNEVGSFMIKLNVKA